MQDVKKDADGDVKKDAACDVDPFRMFEDMAEEVLMPGMRQARLQAYRSAGMVVVNNWLINAVVRQTKIPATFDFMSKEAYEKLVEPALKGLKEDERKAAIDEMYAMAVERWAEATGGVVRDHRPESIKNAGAIPPIAQET